RNVAARSRQGGVRERADARDRCLRDGDQCRRDDCRADCGGAGCGDRLAWRARRVLRSLDRARLAVGLREPAGGRAARARAAPCAVAGRVGDRGDVRLAERALLRPERVARRRVRGTRLEPGKRGRARRGGERRLACHGDRRGARRAQIHLATHLPRLGCGAVAARDDVLRPRSPERLGLGCCGRRLVRHPLHDGDGPAARRRRDTWRGRRGDLADARCGLRVLGARTAAARCGPRRDGKLQSAAGVVGSRCVRPAGRLHGALAPQGESAGRIRIAMNVLNPVRTIPLLPWSAERPAWTWQRPVTLAVLFLGLWLFGTGEAGLINAGLGNTPWTVLAQGIARQTPLDIGTATIVISIVVLLGWIPLRQRPGIGTVANVIVIGVAIDVMTHVVPHPHALVLRGAQAALAIVTVGLGSAFYLTANLGPGPRDGWMTGI